MIGRLMLSLKKAADTSEAGWSLTGTTQAPNPGDRTPKRSNGARFAQLSDEDTVLPTEEDIPLTVVSCPMP